jgi:hypothetical protein
MYMSVYYIQNIVPKICACDYVNMCCADGKFNAHTICSDVNG